MYKKTATLAIPIKRHSFRKGWLLIPGGQTKNARKELMKIMGITSRYYFSTILNKGIKDIRLSQKEEIDNFFNKYGITDCWDVLPQ